MTLAELAERKKIREIWVIAEDGDRTVCKYGLDIREKYGMINLHVSGQGIFESNWQTIQYPHETVGFGLVVLVEGDLDE